MTWSRADPAVSAREVEGGPWAQLPREVADYLASNLPGTADEIVAAMRAEIPAYREPLAGPFGDEVGRSVRLVLDQFVVLVRSGEANLGPRRGLFRAFGREEVRAGRTLDALLAAYRVGARLAWRRTRDAASRAGLPAETMSLLAEATFAYIDQLSAISAEGFADEQSVRAGSLERERAALAQLLVGPIAPDAAVLEQAAVGARWPVPTTLAALVWAPTDDDRLLSRLPQDSLAGVASGLRCALIGDPDGPGRRAEITRAVGDRLAVLGSTAVPTQAGRSLRRAGEIHALAERGLLARGGLILAEEHLADAVLHGSPELLADLAERALAPLDRLGERARVRQAETLLAWLEHHGDTVRIARAVHVHPQTVRYRLAQLRELFGSALDDRHARFELLLALRGRRPVATDGRTDV